MTFTATVPAGATGTVTFEDNGAAISGAVPISGTIATFATSTLVVGTHPIIAVYSGDTNYTAAASTAVSQVVNKATPTITLASSLNPSTFGANVTFTATLPAGATGTVTFEDNGAAISGAVPISGTTATFTTATLVVGTHPIIAVYGGDTNYNAAVLDGGIPGCEQGDPDRYSGLFAQPLDLRGKCDLYGDTSGRRHRAQLPSRITGRRSAVQCRSPARRPPSRPRRWWRVHMRSPRCIAETVTTTERFARTDADSEHGNDRAIDDAEREPDDGDVWGPCGTDGSRGTSVWGDGHGELPRGRYPAGDVVVGWQYYGGVLGEHTERGHAYDHGDL